MNRPTELLYIGQSRLHRDRANLIQTLHTVEGFSKCGVNVTLYLPPWHKEIILKTRLLEIGVEPSLDIQPIQFLHSRWPLWIFTRMYKKKLQAVKNIYVRSARISMALAAQRMPHNLELHTLRGLNANGVELQDLISNQQAGHIDYFIAISQAIADDLITAGAEPRKIHVSPSGVDIDAFGDIPSSTHDMTEVPRIVYVGRVSHDRGLGILIQLAERQLGRVLLVGAREDDIPQMVGLTYRKPIPHRDVPSVYADSDLILLPYQPDLLHADGISPLKLFEAMAAGRPIIASDIRPIREILVHNRSALLVAPNDTEAWCQSVTRLRNDPDLARRLAGNARKDAAQYSWTNRTKQILTAIGLRQ